MGTGPRLVAARVLLVTGAAGLTSLHALEPGYPPSTATLSDYALSPHGWVFTASLLCLAAGSALVLLGLWPIWRVRRWLVLVWTLGNVVVAVVTTDPVGATVTTGGRVHAAWASAGIGALLLAEAISAVVDRTVRWRSALAAATGLIGLAATPLIGFGAAERIVVGVHIAWLVSLTVGEVADGSTAGRSGDMFER
jgi:hypothetical protein